MDKLNRRANVLLEALPFIREFYGKTIVIKYGGAAMVQAELKQAVITDIVLMHYVGMRPILVHGGGPEVSQMMNRVGLEPQFVGGLRVTDADTMDIAEMVLGGKINKQIVSLINQHGGKAVGLTGKDAHLIYAEKLTHHSGEEVDLGYVGEVRQINPEIIHLLVREGYIPVVSSIGVGVDGTSYNLNADHIAGQLAAALEATKLIMLTDVPGILRDPDDETTLISEFTPGEARRMLEGRQFGSGMIPKVQGCLMAAEKGVAGVHILDGRVEHSILMEVFTEGGTGTMIRSG